MKRAWSDPAPLMPEGIEYGVCAAAPGASRCAIRAAELGASEDACRRLVTSLAIPARTVVSNEGCMQQSGLWPWASASGSQAGLSARTCSVEARA